MTDAPKKPNPVKLVVNNPEPAPPLAAPEPARPDSSRAETQSALPRASIDEDGGRSAPPAPLRPGELPENCPVRPLGIRDDCCYYIDAHNQVRELRARDHSHLNLRHLFGAQHWVLPKYWPKLNRAGVPTGNFRPEDAAQALMVAASYKGVWNPFERLRGVGAWTDDEGELVLHAGDKVMVGGAWLEPGQVIGRHVYPASDPQPRPAKQKCEGGATGPAHTLLEILRTWNWRQPERDPELLLGWIVAAMFGGALGWRPMLWVTGSPGEGKSTLHSFIKLLFGGEGSIIAASDASAAGIWQKLGQSSLPVALDEFEPDEDNRKARAIISLARRAASGSVLLRGGADHHGAEFRAQCCFLFSSILIPPLTPAERSRMAILELDKLKAGAVPTLDRKRLAELGGQLRRRFVDGWERFEPTLNAYRSSLAGVGHTGRGTDQFGNILACLDLVESDHPTSGDELDQWAERLAPSAQELSEEDADHYRCAQHALTSIVDVYSGGKRKTVSQLVAQAMGVGGEHRDGDNVDKGGAQEALGTIGLRVFREKLPERAPTWWLAIANDHRGTESLFKGSHWAGGVWVQAWQRVRDARRGTAPRHFAGKSSRCWELPLDLLMPDVIKAAEEALAPPR